MRVTDVATSIEGLPARYRGNSISARFRLKVGRTSRDIVVTPDECVVQKSNGTPPNAEIITDVETWRLMDAGKMSGIEAFVAQRLKIRGSIEKSLHFETLFDRPDAGAVRYEIRDVRVPGASISALIAGPESAPPVVLIHGLGATKASWLTVVPALARHHRVVAIDLPGFGASSKPLGSYKPKWFAGYVVDMLDGLGIESALLAGNSMGGRISMELAMSHPDRVEGIACLCPAAAFTYRPALLLARILRPELGMFAGRLPRQRVKDGLKQLFANSSTVDENWYDAAIDDFLDVWKSPRARIAFSRSLRHIYLDEPEGETGFWNRLSNMEKPSLFIYGKRDALITHRFSTKIRKTLPNAKVLVWKDCGHVPQIEFPERTARAMLEFYARASSTKVAS